MNILSYLSKARKSRGSHPLQTVRCLPLLAHDTNQSKESVGNYIIYLETSDELVEITESKRVTCFEVFQRCHKRGLKISLDSKMKTRYLIEWSNGEAYQSIMGNWDSFNCFFGIRINLPSL